MKFEIKHRRTGDVLFECDADLREQAVEQAAKVGVRLRSADLGDADLRGANLSAVALAAMRRMAEEEAMSVHNLPPIPRVLTCA
ncbi:hypothetical protein [Ralstonia phage BHDT_So9]|uniref:Pentapeptide repeat-containing protein n=1 Tax=Ralstonia phage BHDT_So9 TaxID=2972464 RepID=A0A9E7U8G9_9CAUD|nr:hypothetical protein [Ralstonia phage BHDT_So9]UWI83540.1 hypothetical protein [Ralstonia phage DLDT_So2]UZT26928.1 putative pentapeptide repeat protein [Ralstonia phage BHDTSo81]WEM03410.1 hypothetical protein [Ralstonia phage BHDT8]